MPTIRAMAATAAKRPLQPFEFDPGPLGEDAVEIAVTHCGICHSDLSMLDNEWGMSKYPFVPGHEITGTISAIGRSVKDRKVGQRVGLGWYARSCMACRMCIGGDHNLCPTAEGTIVGRHGGFASHVRAHWAWVSPLPDGLDPTTAGPMLCGGITVFNPIVQLGIRPTHCIGVVGIGGLGHIALQFVNKWGCDVTAFSSSSGKEDEARRLGAHHVVNSRDDAAMAKLAGRFDMILVTVNVSLNWPAFLNTLAPRGRLHFVGAVLEPLAIPAMALIMQQRSVTGSPLGSPATTADMLEFSARHKIAPVTESFPMSKVNDALAHLRAGKARYRIVLHNDLK